ncbi:hypothetical protein GGR50DRAFT_161863 [Xylaria sp. CBS 124048]|nr:hypothetical protein GGR50DRAFT_161863 [Xylaria sp. CBS 124048]
MPPESSRDAPLMRAIDAANGETLRMIMKSMCQESEACREAAMAHMVVSRKHDIIELSDSDDNKDEGKDEGDKGGQQQSKKRKRTHEATTTNVSRYEVCVTCKEMYDVTLNDDEACQTHDDLLIIDPEFFPDDDEVQYEPHGIDVNTDWRRETCPEGFVWQCCEEPLDGDFCVIQRHIPRR